MAGAGKRGSRQHAALCCWCGVCAACARRVRGARGCAAHGRLRTLTRSDTVWQARRMLASTPYGVFQMLPVNAPQAPNAFFTKQDVSAAPAPAPAPARVAALPQSRSCPSRALLASAWPPRCPPAGAPRRPRDPRPRFPAPVILLPRSRPSSVRRHGTRTCAWALRASRRSTLR